MPKNINKITLKNFHDNKIDLPTLEVELFEDEDCPNKIGVYISNDGSSGCEYYVDSVDEIGPIVSEYVLGYYLDMKDLNSNVD